MLSLKAGVQHVQSARPFPLVSRLVELPTELLEHIIELAGCDRYRTETLCPLSLVSSRLRNLAQKLLFCRVNLVLSRKFTRVEQTFIEWLLCHPRIRLYIKHVAVRAPLMSLPADDVVECRKLVKLLPMLPNIESLWLHCLNYVTFPLVKSIPSLNRNVHLTIAATNLVDMENIEAGIILLPELLSGALMAFENLLSAVTCVKAVKLFEGSVGTYQEHLHTEMLDVTIQDQLEHITQQPAWRTLEEVQLDSRFLLPIDGSHCSEYAWMGDLGASIKRLSVHGHAVTFPLFLKFASSLDNLVSVKFRCTYPYQGMRDMPEIPESPFARLVKLRELELEQVKSDIPLAYFANQHLRKLKIHSAGSLLRPVSEHLTVKIERTPEEISSIRKLFPLLEHLAIDIGRVSMLWHPTAIPGVDVDVIVYAVLNALARLRLNTLRLFPSYSWLSRHEFGGHGSRFCQPLNDEQAIKIFNYLKSQSPTLQNFAISTDNQFESGARHFDFHAMSWTMHMRGSLTILITRQALRDYEQKQVWAGERKLTTEIRRFAYLKPYVPDSPDSSWIIPPSF